MSPSKDISKHDAFLIELEKLAKEVGCFGPDPLSKHLRAKLKSLQQNQLVSLLEDPRVIEILDQPARRSRSHLKPSPKS